MQVSRTSVVAFLLCAAAVVAVESDIVPETSDDLTPQSLYEQVSELYESSLLDSHPKKRSPTTKHNKMPKSKKPIKGGKGETPTAAGKGLKKHSTKKKAESKAAKAAKVAKEAKAAKALVAKAKADAAEAKKKVDEEWPSAVQAVAELTAPTPAQVADVKATAHNALQGVVNSVLKGRKAIKGADSAAMKNIAAEVTKARAGIVAVANKDHATGTKNLLSQMSFQLQPHPF